MRPKSPLLLAAIFLTANVAARANTITYGPITFGSNTPLISDGFNSQFNLLQVITPPVYLTPPSPLGDASFTQTIAFYFDLAPGWTISGMTFYDPVDYGTNQQNPQNWGYEFAQNLTLCPATSTCMSTSTSGHGGGYTLPPMSMNAQAGPNVGIYQAAGYSHNAQAATVPGESGVNIWLTQTAVAPEPSTFILLGTGALGLIGAAKRKLSPS